MVLKEICSLRRNWISARKWGLYTLILAVLWGNSPPTACTFLPRMELGWTVRDFYENAAMA